MLVQAHHHRLQLEGQAAIEAQADPLHAAIVRAGNAGEPLVGFARAAIQRDLDRERPPLRQVVGHLGRDEIAVGVERDEEAESSRVGVDVEKILSRQDFSAGVQNPQTSSLGQLVEDAAMFRVGELLELRLAVAHRQVVVAMCAHEGTAPGDFNCHVERQLRGPNVLVQRLAELTVADGFHAIRLPIRRADRLNRWLAALEAAPRDPL